MVYTVHHITLNHRTKMKAHFLISIQHILSKQGHGNELHFSKVRHIRRFPSQNTFMKAKAKCMLHFNSWTFVRMKFNARIITEMSLPCSQSLFQ